MKEKKKPNLRFEIIVLAVQGDEEALCKVLAHYEAYVKVLIRKKLYDESGGIYYWIDEEIKQHIENRLIEAILKFKIL